MMSIILYEAQDRAFEEIKMLALSGIEVRITPARSRTNEETIEKFKDRLPVDRWVHVSFRVKDRSELDSVFQVGDRLRGMGIYFDTGGCKGQRDWELDWSLQMKENL